MAFRYNKIGAKCMWCKRTKNPHPDYNFETIPTKVFISKKGKRIELCFSCFEYETIKSKKNNTDFKKNLDLKYDTLKILNI